MTTAAAIACALLLGQAPPDFAATFAPAAVASHLEGKAAYLVAGAGPETPALAAAAAALEAALRAGGAAELVMNGKSLGPLADADDPGIVKRCAPLPVARVAVVRVFEEPGQAPRAVVAVYDREGAVRAAFTGQAGVSLAAAAGVATGQGRPASVAAAVLAPGPARAAQEEYDTAYISFDEGAAVGQYGRVVRWVIPYQGKLRKTLEGGEFYRVIGRNDLLEQYQANEKSRTTVRIVGLVGGGAVALLGLTKSVPSCGAEPPLSSPAWSAWMTCDGDRNSAQMKRLVIAGAGLAVGIGVYALSSLMELHPIDAGQARGLADDYNRQLKARLGLAAAEPRRPAEEGPRLSVSLVALRGGGGLGLGLRF